MIAFVFFDPVAWLIMLILQHVSANVESGWKIITQNCPRQPQARLNSGRRTRDSWLTRRGNPPEPLDSTHRAARHGADLGSQTVSRAMSQPASQPVALGPVRRDNDSNRSQAPWMKAMWLPESLNRNRIGAKEICDQNEDGIVIMVLGARALAGRTSQTVICNGIVFMMLNMLLGSSRKFNFRSHAWARRWHVLMRQHTHDARAAQTIEASCFGPGQETDIKSRLCGRNSKVINQFTVSRKFPSLIVKMSFPSDQSQASMDTALSSLQSSPTQPEFPVDRVPGKKKSNKRNLLLFFDGTGNEFSGTEKDTNVVKLLSMLDRNHEDQFHYYQSKHFAHDMHVPRLKNCNSWYRNLPSQRTVRTQRTRRKALGRDLLQCRPGNWVDLRCPYHGWLQILDALLRDCEW